MKRSWKTRLLKELAFVVIIGTPVLLFFLVMTPRSHAARLLRQLRAVEVYQTRFQNVEALARQYGASAACVGDNCLFQFQNIWLRRLRLAPRTEFSVMLRRAGSQDDPGGGRVASMDMAMLVSQDSLTGGAIASALVFDRMAQRDFPAYEASITIGADGKAGRTVVRLSPRADARQRRQARAFNLGCLTRIGGCRTSRQLLPAVWRGARRIHTVSLAPRQGARDQARPSSQSDASSTLAAIH